MQAALIIFRERTYAKAPQLRCERVLSASARLAGTLLRKS